MATYEGIDTLKIGNDTIKLGSSGGSIDINKLLSCLYRDPAKAVTGADPYNEHSITTVTASAPCRIRFEFIATHNSGESGTYSYGGSLGATQSEAVRSGQATIGRSYFSDTFPRFLNVLSNWEFTEENLTMYISTGAKVYYGSYQFRPVSIFPPEGVSLDDFDPDSIEFTVEQL